MAIGSGNAAPRTVTAPSAVAGAAVALRPASTSPETTTPAVSGLRRERRQEENLPWERVEDLPVNAAATSPV